MKIFGPLYDRVIDWSRHKYAERYLAAAEFCGIVVLSDSLSMSCWRQCVLPGVPKGPGATRSDRDGIFCDWWRCRLRDRLRGVRVDRTPGWPSRIIGPPTKPAASGLTATVCGSFSSPDFRRFRTRYSRSLRALRRLNLPGVFPCLGNWSWCAIFSRRGLVVLGGDKL